MLRRTGAGGITIPPRKVDWKETAKEIILFVSLYSLASIAQIIIICAVAVLLGTLSGPTFLLLIFLLEFSPRVYVELRPARIGIYFLHQWHAEKKRPSHIAFAQAILSIASAIAIALVITDYFPRVWQWRIGWSGENYIMLSRFSWDDAGKWYVASTTEVLTRIILVFAVPFVGWVSTLVMKWAAYMEATRPTARETTHGVVSPETLVGPCGEGYKAQKTSGADGDGAMVVIPPDYE